MNGSDVQIDNGNYARIHNAILENLSRCDLTGSEFRCVLFLLRATYGWGKKADTISYSQWAEGTNLQRRSAMRALSKLVDRRIILATENGLNRPITWQFNKYFEQWIDIKTGDQIDTSSAQTGDRVDTSFDDDLVTGLTLDSDSTGDRVDTSSAQTGDRVDTKTGDRVDTHKRKERKTTTTDNAIDAENVNCESSSSFSASDGKTYRDVCDAYMANGFGAVTALTSELIGDDVDTYSAEWCIDAMKIAVKGGKRNWAYVSGILKNWQAEGRKADLKAQPVTVGGTVDWWE